MKDTLNIVSLFFAEAKAHPDRLAIADVRETITYHELASRVRARAAQFKAKGIQSGDRVLVFVPMSIGLYIDSLALFTMGATAVFLDEWVNLKRLDLCCRIAQCRAFIAPTKFRLPGIILSSAIRQIPIKIGTRRATESNTTLEPVSIDETNVTALITFTTGSTGTPKAAKRTHAFLHEQFKALLEKIDPQDDEIDMPALPIVLMINLACGIPSIIPNWKPSKPAKMEPSKIWDQIERFQVNRLTSSPYFLERLSAHILEEKRDTSNFRKLFTGGAPVFPTQASLFNDAFPKAAVNIIFGSTEAEPISAINAKELITHSTTKEGLNVGFPHRTTQVRIIQWRDETISAETEADLDCLTLPPGEVGEITVAGDHVLREYYNNQEALLRNKIFIANQCWHRTGDGGYIAPDGTLRLMGRCSQFINTPEGTIYPFLIEHELSNLNGIIIGTLLEINHQLTFAIEATPEGDQQSIRESLQSMVPNSKVIFTAIPRDKRHHSKIDYGKLGEALLR
ncbi:MAG: AMP-binding protein [Flavobacteriales bacterium]|nr:AMP-binding protein [Flavobacteriales bacterium]